MRTSFIKFMIIAFIFAIGTIIFVVVDLIFEKRDKKEIKDKQNLYLNKRQTNQPYGEFSLGSVFKRGENFFPAKLIDDFGFKGFSVGDVEVSKKHAGFIINKGSGKAKDFLSVVEEIENFAKKKGYLFEREFVSIGFKE